MYYVNLLRLQVAEQIILSSSNGKNIIEIVVSCYFSLSGFHVASSSLHCVWCSGNDLRMSGSTASRNTQPTTHGNNTRGGKTKVRRKQDSRSKTNEKVGIKTRKEKTQVRKLQ